MASELGVVEQEVHCAELPWTASERGVEGTIYDHTKLAFEAI